MTDFTDDQRDALRELADDLLEVDQLPPAPPVLRIVDGDAIVHPIACAASLLAARTGEERPRCRWLRDCGGYSCTRCGSHVGPGMERHGVLAHLFGDEQPGAEGQLAAWEAEIRETAARLVEQGEPAETATLRAGALLLLTHARTPR